MQDALFGQAPGVNGDVEHVLVDDEQVPIVQKHTDSAKVHIEPGPVPGDQVPCIEQRDCEDVGAPPSPEGIGNDPDGPDVHGILHAGLEGNNLVLNEDRVLRVQWS